jgi:hypothetical protein
VAEEKVESVAAAAGSPGKSRAAGIGAPTSNAVWSSAIERAERWKASMVAIAPAGVPGAGVRDSITHRLIDATMSSRARCVREA